MPRSTAEPNQQPPLQTIGSFARSVGLSVSALRSYGASGLLVPADVDERTGYRYYTPAQWQRAIWIRRLRDAGLPLDQIRALLDSPPDAAARLLDSWIADSLARSATAGQVAADLRASMHAAHADAASPETRARIDAAVLGAAITQVRSASARAEDGTGLEAVLIEVSDNGVAVVATNRYLLLARTNLPADVTGPSTRIPVTADPAIGWLRGRADIDLVATRSRQDRDHRVVLRDTSGSELVVPRAPDLFPSVDQVLETDAVRVSRIVAPRLALADVAGHPSTDRPTTIRLVAGGDDAAVVRANHRVPVRHVGRPVTLELSAAAVSVIAGAAVGAEVICDIHETGHPLLWRDPSQPDFVGLMMARA